MAIPNKLIQLNDRFEVFCDWGIVFSLCALIFVLPASIAFLDSFAALAIFIYLLKKTYRIVVDWRSRISHLDLLGKVRFIWNGFAPPVNFLNRPLQFLTLAVFISVLFSQYPALSFLAFVGKFIKCLFLYFCTIEVLSDERRVRVFLCFFLLSAFITTLDGTFQHYTGKDFLKGHRIGTENFVSTQRISSTFFGANGFGAYLLPVIGLVAHFLYSAVARKKSWIWGGGLALFLVLLISCLCWSYSRSSWVGYLLMLFLMVWMDRHKVLFAGALFLVFYFIFLPSLSNIRHMELISDNIGGTQKEESVQSVLENGGSGRSAYWKRAISIIRLSPVWGTGLNTYARIIMRDPDRKKWWYAHNGYLQMAAETGLLGLSCFLWVLLVLFRHGFEHCAPDIHHHPWTLAALQGTISGLFGFLGQSFFDNTFYTVQLSVLMWMVFGLLVAVTRLTPQIKKINVHKKF